MSAGTQPMLAGICVAALAAAVGPGCRGGGGDDDARADMVRIESTAGAYYIDRYEYPNVAGEKPTTYVNLATVRELCAAAGKRPCTAAEWRRACAGADGSNRFGYEGSFARGRCHTASGLPSGHTSMVDPEDQVVTAGERAECATPEGVHDLIGNVEEWVLDDWRGVDGMLEGGAWYTFTEYADCSGRYSRQPDYRLDPERRVYSAGFRCCWSEAAPDEASLTADAIAADATARLDEARAQGSADPYDADAEVQVLDGLWIDRYEYPNRPFVYPRTVVSWEEAQGLCEAAGKRLCATHEWEYACAADHDWAQPYGPTFIPSACGVELDGPTRGGAYLACASPSGAHDLVGGVWEWTASPLDVPGLKAHPDDVLRELRGGSWFVDAGKGVCRPARGYPAAPQDAVFPDVGFRCCRGEAAAVADAPIPAAIRCPETMVAVGAVCVDRYEHPNREGERPTGNLDLDGARQACAARGLHVCREEEWLRACAGDRMRRWPYGDTYVAGRCNDESWARQTHRGEPTVAGQHADCRTPEGVVDLSGNLWEWVTTADGAGALRGGGWNVSAGLGQCRARAGADASYASPEAGTRCCGTADEIASLPAAGAAE